MKTQSPRPQAFTLIEILIVIAIIGILMALLFPAINGAILSARRAQARNDVVQIATAVTGYVTEYGRYPTNVAGPVDVSGYLLEQLMGSNARAIVFLEVQNAKLRPKGPGQSGFFDGAFVDPWGDPYQVAFDLTYMSTLSGVGPKGEKIRKSVAVWNDPAKGNNKDKYPTQLERRHAESW